MLRSVVVLGEQLHSTWNGLMILDEKPNSVQTVPTVWLQEGGLQAATPWHVYRMLPPRSLLMVLTVGLMYIGSILTSRLARIKKVLFQMFYFNICALYFIHLYYLFLHMYLRIPLYASLVSTWWFQEAALYCLVFRKLLLVNAVYAFTV